MRRHLLKRQRKYVVEHGCMPEIPRSQPSAHSFLFHSHRKVENPQKTAKMYNCWHRSLAWRICGFAKEERIMR